MISVDEAFSRIIQTFSPLGAEEVPLAEALGRVLAAPVVSPEHVPGFDNSAMDGYAVRVADCAGASEEAPARLRVVADLAAGRVSEAVVAPGTAIRIMTGAPVPVGADAVVMREETREWPDLVEVLVPPEPGEHIRRAGEDLARGAEVFAAGTALNAAALGVLGSIGLSTIRVVRRPRVAILATGDELVPIEATPGPGQLRNSSAVALEALVRQAGAEPVMLGIARDDRAELASKIREGARYDVLLTTGGVSVGDYDLVKAVLEELGAMSFWKVNMQPGKPLAFGHLDGTPVFGLPGNPVSSLVSYEIFVRPALRRLAGHAQWRRTVLRVALAAPIHKKSERRQFLRARLSYRDGGFVGTLAGAQGSHVLSGVARANGLLVLPEGPARYEAGEMVEGLLLEEISDARGHSDAQ